MTDTGDRQVWEMKDGEAELRVIHERRRRGPPLAHDCPRQLFNPQLYMLAYGRICANDGASHPGL